MTTHTHRSTVVGVFHDRAAAQKAVDELRRAGFREDQIGVIARDHSKTETGAALNDETGSEMGTGSAVGAATGAGVGALWALGIAAGMLPAIGPVVAGGLLMSVLASAGGAAVVGTIVGALIGMGIPEDEATYYETEFKSGRTLVTVKTDGRYDEAYAILRRHGAYDMQTRSESTAAHTAAAATSAVTSHTGSAGTTTYPAASAQAVRTANAAGEQVVQLKEEELHAHKQPVKAGEVRVRKEVVTEHKVIDVPVEREEVVIERRAVSGHQVTANDIRPGEEVRIPVKEEQVRVEKQAVVKEEVQVGKRKVHETERVVGDVRKEELRVEEEGKVNVKGNVNTNRKS